MEDKLCLAPWTSIIIEPNGDIKPCCVFSYPLAKFKNTKDLKDIYNGNAYNQLRKQMLDGYFPIGCEACKNKEKRQLKSKRMKINGTFGHLVKSIKFNNQSQKIRFLEISFSNSCNLACNMCDSRYSSKWFFKDKELIEMGLRPKSHNRYMKAFGIPNEEIEGLADLTSSLDSIEIIGGEPLYDKRCQRFLSLLGERYRQPRVLITTNATIVDDSMLEILKKIRNLSVNISIDGTGKVYEYIRGTDFRKVDDNIRKLIKLDNINHVSVHPTVTVYNAFNLYNICVWFQTIVVPDKKFKLIFDQLASGPQFLTVNKFPRVIKVEFIESLQYLIEKYQNNDMFDTKSLQGIVNYLDDNMDDVNIEDLVTYTEYHNGKVGFDIRDHVSELGFIG